MIEITLPFPPTLNHYKSIGRLQTTKSGKIYQQRFNSVETKRYFLEVWRKCRQQNIISFGDARINLEVDIYPRDNRKRDISNLVKVLEDSLMKAGCFDDDSQIDKLVVQRCSVVENGMVIVRIKEIEHEK